MDSIILKYDHQTPRYTSYPTAPHFNSEVNYETYKNWLLAIPQKSNISLYLHIPFCNQLCWYCGCYTKATQRYAPVEDYAHILAREIRIVANLIKDKKTKISHIHFGGGSPTILLPQSFEFVMNVIRQEFKIDKKAEIAIEVDPRNINEEKVSTYAKAGINRVSIGVQDFNLEVQKAINREQSFDLVYETVKLFRKYQINDINFDLIYGLPKQNIEMIKKNIYYSLSLQPSRIALFSYAHVQWMKKHMRLIDEKDLPDTKNKLLMYRTASEILIKENYRQIGLDHFAKPTNEMSLAVKSKKLKRNFQGYSTDKANFLIGFGASAISYLGQGYAQNTLDFEEYKKEIISEKLPIKKGIALKMEDKIRKEIIDEIMCFLKVDLNKICKKFNLETSYFNNEIKLLKPLEKDKLIKIKNNKIDINKNFPQISRVVACKFDQFFKADLGRHSKIS